MIWTTPPRGTTQIAQPHRAAHIVSCEQADDGSTKAAKLFFLIGVTSLAGAGAAATVSNLSLAMALTSSAIGYLLYTPALVTQTRLRRRAARYWRHERESTVTSASWIRLLYSCFVITATSTGLVYSVWLAWSQPTNGFITGISTTGFVTLIFTSAGSSLGTSQIALPSSSAIKLTPEGILFWPEQKHETSIPWHEVPAINGTHNGALHIVTRQNKSFIVPVSHLQPGFVQLCRTIEFYAQHPELCHELGTSEGLPRVQLLMNNTVEQVEQTLLPRKRDRDNDDGDFR